MTIKTLYRLPSRKKVPMVLFRACQFIFTQEVPVSPLNIEYRGHCVPREEERAQLRAKYGARFGGYYDEQDDGICRRFLTLMENHVVEDRMQFCRDLDEYCSGKNQLELIRTSRRTIGVRNIVGLYVGQDIPNKIAFIHCQRLVRLVLGSSMIFRLPRSRRRLEMDVDGLGVRSQGEESSQGEDEVQNNEEDNESENVPLNSQKIRPVITSTIKTKWTMEEDQTLLDLIVGVGEGTKVEDVETIKVDWEGIAEELVGRSAVNIRCHWVRVVQPALVEDLKPGSILAYRKRLLKEVIKMGANHRKEINWNKLAEIFHPRSKESIVSHHTPCIGY